jgi:hypothetical protein
MYASFIDCAFSKYSSNFFAGLTLQFGYFQHSALFEIIYRVSASDLLFLYQLLFHPSQLFFSKKILHLFLLGLYFLISDH